MTRKSKLIWLQIILGVAFLLQPIILPVRPDFMDKFVFSRDVLKNIFANSLILAFFYLNYFIFVPRYYLSKKYLYYFIIVTFCFSTILYISNKFTNQLSFTTHNVRPSPPIPFGEQAPPPFRFNRPPPPPQGSFLSKCRFFFAENDQTFFLFGSIVLFSLFLHVRNRYYNIENAKQEAEINYLLAQINPHFLFNALNSIYTLTIKEKAPNSSSSLLKLSGLMRYVITETHQNNVPLEKELVYISDFIDLQKLRLTSNVKLNYAASGKISGKQIAPMLLIPFVENAFKHGVSPEEDSSIQIKIDVSDHHLIMEVSNLKVTINNDSIGKSGFGIANAKNRLALLYPNKHDLRIYETNETFNVVLIIFF